MGVFKSRIDSSKILLLQKLAIVLISVLLVATIIIAVLVAGSSRKGSEADIFVLGLFAPLNYMILAFTVYLHVKGELLTDKLTLIWAFALLFVIQSVFIDIVLSLMK